MERLRCEACGSALDIKDENAQYVTCEYCNTKYKLNDKSQIEFRIDDNTKEILKQGGKIFKSFSIVSAIGTLFVIGFIIVIAVLIGSAAYKQIHTPNKVESNTFNTEYEKYAAD